MKDTHHRKTLLRKQISASKISFKKRKKGRKERKKEGRKGGRDGGREGGREGGRKEGRKEGKKKILCVNFTGQYDWAKGCPDSWLNIIFECVCESVSRRD